VRKRHGPIRRDTRGSLNSVWWGLAAFVIAGLAIVYILAVGGTPRQARYNRILGEQEAQQQMTDHCNLLPRPRDC
jgi:hypothetical protein